MERDKALAQLSDLLRPRVRGHVVNDNVVQHRPMPAPDYARMQRVIDAGRSLTKKTA